MAGETRPSKGWCYEERMSRHKGGKLCADGEVDTVLVMGRRHILWRSWLDYLERRRQGVERDPIAKQRAAEIYRRDSDEILRRQGRSLTRGSVKGKPNRKPETLVIGRRVSQPDKRDLFEENSQSQ